MKSARDPRHQKRRELVQELFAISFSDDQTASEKAKEIISISPMLDEYINKAAPAWPIDKLNKIDLAILRLAVHEMKNNAVPPKVSIDEAVELAKEFGSESSPSFVNGVLGTILKEVNPDYIDTHETKKDEGPSTENSS